jgi:hypothetical protein
MACTDLCTARIGAFNFSSEDSTATEGNVHARVRAGKLAWVEKRVEYHCKHWKAFEKAFMQHYADLVSHTSNMAVDELVTAPGGSGE